MIRADNNNSLDEHPLETLQNISARINVGNMTKIGIFCVVKLLMPMK